MEKKRRGKERRIGREEKKKRREEERKIKKVWNYDYEYGSLDFCMDSNL